MFFPKKLQIFLLLLCMVLGFVSLLNAQTIKYIGSPTLNPFIRTAARIYKDASFEIITKSNSHKILISDMSERADILGMADDVDPEFILLGAKKYLIGKEAIGVWVNKNNPISNLSFGQLAAIYTGEITHWQALGSYNQPIHIYIINPHSPCKQVFEKIVLKSAKYNDKYLHTVKPDPSVLKKIGEDPGGLGFFSLSEGLGHKSRHLVKTMFINGQAASNNNFDYPITRPLYFVTIAEPWGKEIKFINWILSDQGQKIVKKFFIGHSPSPVLFSE